MLICKPQVIRILSHNRGGENGETSEYSTKNKNSAEAPIN